MTIRSNPKLILICLSILLFSLLFTVGFVRGHQSSNLNGHEHHHHSHHNEHGHSHDHGHEHSHGHHHSHSQENPSFKYSREANERIISTEKPETRKEKLNVKNESYNIWLSALSSTLMISVFPFLILFFIPLNNTNEHQSLLKTLLSFASGGLLGDAFLHLIPHALLAKQGEQAHSHSHSHSHSHGDGEHHEHDMSVGLWVLAGILAFLIIEKFIRIVKGPGHGHSHGGASVVAVDADAVDNAKDGGEKKEKSKAKKDKSPVKEKDNGDQSDVTSEHDEHKSSASEKVKKRVHFDKEVIEKEERKEQSNEIKVAGYLNLAADFTHNLTDGLAIGASFLAGKNIGYITAITILLHEIPHEIGDFAILIQSGCSKRKAMLLQLITAFGAFTGTILSLLTEGMGGVAQAWILPFTAGGFIYIATVSVIPELLEGTSLKQSIREIFALIFGVFLMILIAKYE